MTGMNTKADLRMSAVAARKLARATADAEQALTHLVAYINAVPGIDIVSGYCPMRTELDPTPALTALHAQGYRICMPVVVAVDAPLRFRMWTPGAAMTRGVFGTVHPEAGEEAMPEALITPLLAFDRDGFRLGYGGGFYDRTLASLRAERRTLGVGLAYDAQRVDAVPVEPTDQRLDAIVTEAGTYYAG